LDRDPEGHEHRHQRDPEVATDDETGALQRDREHGDDHAERERVRDGTPRHRTDGVVALAEPDDERHGASCERRGLPQARVRERVGEAAARPEALL
jgi:hypothetical protein